MLRKNMEGDNNIRRYMHMRRRDMARLVMQRRPGLHIMGSILRVAWGCECCCVSIREEQFDDAIRDDLGNGQYYHSIT